MYEANSVSVASVAALFCFCTITADSICLHLHLIAGTKESDQTHTQITILFYQILPRSELGCDEHHTIKKTNMTSSRTHDASSTAAAAAGEATAFTMGGSDANKYGNQSRHISGAAAATVHFCALQRALSDGASAAHVNELITLLHVSTSAATNGESSDRSLGTKTLTGSAQWTRKSPS